MEGFVVSDMSGKLVVENAAPLKPGAMMPLPLGSVKPAGWLLSQLRVQAAGLSGHLEDAIGPSHVLGAEAGLVDHDHFATDDRVAKA